MKPLTAPLANSITQLNVDIKGQGKPIVLLHGWGTNTTIFKPFLQALHDLGLQTHSIDLPGYGFNKDFNSSTAIEDIAEAVAQRINEPSIILGWSLGGLIASQIAHQFPEKISHLIKVASTPKFCADDDNWRFGIATDNLTKFVEGFVADQQRTLSDFINLHLRTSELDFAEKQAIKKDLMQIEPCAKALEHGVSLLQNMDLRQQVAELSIPTLYLLGGRDGLVPATARNDLQAILSDNAAVQVIEQAAHIPFLSHADASITIIKDFINHDA